MAKKEERLARSKDGLTLKEDGVKILQISTDGTGVVFGLGNDQKIYVWHHSLYFRGNWVLHVNEPKPQEGAKGSN